MVMLRSNIIFSGLLLVMLVGSSSAMAADPQDAKPVAAEAGEETTPLPEESRRQGASAQAQYGRKPWCRARLEGNGNEIW